MRIYFDTSCLGRPIDDRSIHRNSVERLAIIELFAMARRGELTLLISEVVLSEVRRTKNQIRRRKLEALTRVFHEALPLSDEAIRRGTELWRRGFKTFDALHVAVAEAAVVDRLCTGDDRLRRKCHREPDIRIQVVSPIQLIQEFLK
jgi:predicted nucleic acid-binding protein